MGEREEDLLRWTMPNPSLPTMRIPILLLVLGLVTFSACDSMDGVAGENGDGTAGAAGGMLHVRLTDAPFPFDDADSANVVITRVELLVADSLLDSDSARVVIVPDTLLPFNLLDLRNGVSAPLGTEAIPVGKYHQLRVFVGDSASVVMKDGRVFPLKVPSGSQSGIKVKLPELTFDDAADDVTATVDFNVEQSFVVQGNPSTPAGIRGFLFKPVLKLDSLVINGTPAEVPPSEGD